MATQSRQSAPPVATDHRSPPSVSVIIPTFERRRHVSLAIDSVLAQSYGSVECVVVDDASTDGTREFLETRYGSRIVLIRNPINRDKSFSRNEGVRSSSGDYVCFLDSDDVLTEDSIEQRMRPLIETPSFDGVIFGLVERPGRPADQRLAGKPSGTSLTLREYLEDPAWLHTNGILADRHTMLAHGRFHEQLTIREDVEMFIRLLCRFELRSCGAIVARMRAVDQLRARHHYARIISQGCAFSQALVADPVIASRIEPFLPRIKAREESMLLRALYHNGCSAEFRERYRRAVRSGSIHATWRWRRRYAASFFV